MKPFARNTLILIIAIILDQFIKYFVELKKPLIDLGLVSFHIVTNTGASFGMLQNNNGLLAWVSLIVLGIIMLNVKHIKENQELPLIFIVSGLLGNLIDRVFRGFVVDFIDFKFWPVFNVADSMIVIGVIWLCVTVLIDDFIIRKKTGTAMPNKRLSKKTLNR
jgi:signal peptidase II